MSTQIRIRGANCATCFDTVRDMLSDDPGVTAVHGAFSDQCLEVQLGSMSAEELIAFLHRNLHGIEVTGNGEQVMVDIQPSIERCGRRALILPTDVADFDAVDAAAAATEAQLGPIEVWVNDAMTTIFAPVSELRADDFRRAVEVTFLGQVWGTMAALERMRPRDRGAIVNVGSALAFIGIPLQAAYCSSKFACRGFFESTRAELLHERSNVRMSMVHLPAVNTPQFDWCKTAMHRHPQPVPPIYQPELAAEFIVRAALDGRRSKVLGSWNKLLVVAGRAFPGLGNHYAAYGAWESQLMDDAISPARPSNLRQPADADCDAGSHGGFDRVAGGFWDPSFLRHLPRAGGTLVHAAAATTRSHAQVVARRVRSRQHAT